MRKLAILADIHANNTALQAVWADLNRQNVTDVYHLGDLVGYNPYPVETVEFIRVMGIPGLAGNYDLAVTSDEPDPVSSYLKPTISGVGRAAWEWTAGHLPAAIRTYLGSLPHRLDVEIEGRRLVMVHGSPDSIREYLLPDTPESRLEEIAAGLDADVLLCGHTHIPMVRRAGGVTIINPGSVGKPKDHDPRASYLVLTLDEDGMHMEFRRVEYDVETVAVDILRCGLPEGQAVSLRQGASV